MVDFIEFSKQIKNNGNLPIYPILKLKDVLDRFVEWLKPLVTEEQLKETISKINEIKNNEKIDKKFTEIGSFPEDSWIFNYWVRFHLLIRDSLVPYTNVPIIYENKKIKELTVAQKVAALLYSITKVYLDFRKQENNKYIIGNKVFSNDEFYGTLSSMNNIKYNMDTYYINDNISTGTVISINNNYFWINTVDDNMEVIKFEELLYAIEELLNKQIINKFPNINFVTAEPNRDEAGKYMEVLLEIPKNKEAYQKLKDAIFILNIDEDIPESIIDQLYWACLSKNFNRWHGKGTQFSIAKNGIISMIVDHSYCDGGTEVFLCKSMHEVLEKLEIKSSLPNFNVAIEKIEFIIPENLVEQLNNFYENYKKHMNDFKGDILYLPKLTRKGLLDKGIKSGDGFIHIAMQAAQKLTWGKIYNTYISVDCRKFFRGRTEVNRPVTEEAIKFIDCLLDSNRTLLEKKELLHKALDAHFKRTKLCQSGNGVNRYLYVLEQICSQYKDELDLKEKPKIFNDEGFRIIGENRLSTTSFGNEDMKYCYFPPVMPHGLGIFYMVNDQMSFLITTVFNEDLEILEKFHKNLNNIINMMLEL